MRTNDQRSYIKFHKPKTMYSLARLWTSGVLMQSSSRAKKSSNARPRSYGPTNATTLRSGTEKAGAGLMDPSHLVSVGWGHRYSIVCTTVELFVCTRNLK